MPRDNRPRSGPFATAVAYGTPVAILFLVLTESPAWAYVFLLLVVVFIILWPKEMIRQTMAWRDRGLPSPSWPFWLLSGIAYLAFILTIGALFSGARNFGIACGVTFFVTQIAAMLLRGIQVKKSLHLPRLPGLPPRRRKLMLVVWLAYAVGTIALLLGQYVVALVVGAPAAVSLIALGRDRQRQGRRMLEDALRERAASSPDLNDQHGSTA
jgi:hypothetical protein